MPSTDVVAGTDYLLANYKRLPLCFVRGEGCYLYDEQGRAYLDFLAGIGVNCLGHKHPLLVAAIQHQCEQLIHCSNYYQIPAQATLARQLCQQAALAAAFFGNSGAEANECAFKLARLYQSEHHRPYAYRVVSLKNSFHGRSLATLAATGSSRFHCKFQPLPSGFPNWPADLGVFEKLLDQTCAAVIVEVIQGESGVQPLDEAFLLGLQQLCRQRKVLLIIDEIQTGVGRTGKFFSYKEFNLKPDLVTMAKGLAGGLPVGAVLVSKEIAAVVSAGDHGSTFGGSPLVMAAANQVVEIVAQPQFLLQVEQRGRLLCQLLSSILPAYGLAIRGRGLMLAIYGEEFSPSAEQLQQIFKHCYQNGLLINVAADVALRLLPPLIVAEEQLEEAVAIIEQALTAVLG